MAKFIASKIDLDLELTLLNGEKELLEPKYNITAAKCDFILSTWRKIEEPSEDGKPKIKTIQLLAEELCIIYDKPVEWWMDNFDPSTLSAIIVHIAHTISGVKKK